MSTNFRVRIWGFRGRNLPSKDSNGLSDPFLNCNFDNYKTFKTETVKKDLNPEFKFEIKFDYETRYPDRLDKKAFKIDCYDWDRIGSNDFIGSCSIDLHTLATGPVYHDILLRDGGKPAGRIQFNLEMEHLTETTVTLKEIHVTGLPPTNQDGTTDCYLQYHYSGSKDPKTFKSATQKGIKSPTWPDLEQMYFTATLKEIVKESIIFLVKHNKRVKSDPTLGEARLSLAKYITRVDNHAVKFSEKLVSPENREIGSISGMIVFSNSPKFAQMVDGKHTDTGIVGGFPLVPDVELPKSLATLEAIKAADVKIEIQEDNEFTPQEDPLQERRRSSQYPDLYPYQPSTPAMAPTPAPAPTAAPTEQKSRGWGVAAAAMQSGAFSPGGYAHPGNQGHGQGYPSHATSQYPPTSAPSHPSGPSTSAPSQYPPTSAPTHYPPGPSTSAPSQYPPTAAVPSHQPASTSAPPASHPPQSQTPSIPPGWEQRVDPKSGRTYYVDHATRSTHWSLPSNISGPPKPYFPPQPSRGPPPGRYPPGPQFGAPQGYPQQGFPPQRGYPPQGYPQQGYPPQRGYPPQGYPGGFVPTPQFPPQHR